MQVDKQGFVGHVAFGGSAAFFHPVAQVAVVVLVNRLELNCSVAADLVDSIFADLPGGGSLRRPTFVLAGDD